MNKIYIVMTGLLLVLLLTFRLELVKQYDRESSYVNIPDSIKNELILNTKSLDEVEIINYCVDKTSDLLEYSFKEDVLFRNNISKAHCVTYAKVCSSLCNIAFQNNNINSTAKCVVGYVKGFGINLCNLGYKLFKNHSNYFINHDFVEIQGSNYIMYVDPCLKDLIKSDLKYIKYL